MTDRQYTTLKYYNSMNPVKDDSTHYDLSKTIGMLCNKQSNLLS